MIKVKPETKNSYKADSVSKTIEIRIPEANLILHNEDILAQSVSLNESIETTNNLSFQGCIAACLKFKCADIVQDLEGMWIEADITSTPLDPEDTPETIPLFRGYINDQSNPSHEQNTMEIIAYDALKRINEADVTHWYNSLPATITILNMRNSFFNYLGISQVADYLPNDGIAVTKSLDDKTITGGKIIKAICQINGRFGRISRRGEFEYVHLVEGTEALYPREDLYPADDIYPSDENAVDSVNKAHYIQVSFENYRVASIDQVRFIGKNGTVVASKGTGTNIFNLKDNFLIWGESQANLNSMVTNLYATIQGLWYTPANVTCVGLPYVECGDFVLLATKRSIVRAYVLTRTLSGAQALRDNFDAKGDKTQPKYTPSVQTQITANTHAITSEVSRATSAESGLNTSISNESSRARSAESGLQSGINNEASIRANQINAVNVRCDNLSAKDAQIENLVATKASISDLNATNASIGNLSAQVASVDNLVASKASISDLNATNARISNLEATKVTADQVRAIVGQFDFVTTSRLNTTVQNALQGTITCGTLRAGQIYIYDGGGYISLNTYVHRYA